MEKVLFGLLMLPLVAGELRLNEIKPVFEEMLSYHVDENTFSPRLAQRAFRNYLTQFDPQYRYLLASEYEEFLLKKTHFWEEIAQKYQNNDFSPFQNLNSLVSKSILRSRKLRKQVHAALLERCELKNDGIIRSSFCNSEEELRRQIESDAEQDLYSYAKEHNLSELTREQKLKVFDFTERKSIQHEESYISSKNISLHIIKSISAALDAHSMYYSEEEASEFRQILRKEFCGVGIHLKERVDGPFISYIVPHSPAEASGLVKVGDIIREIDGQPTDKINFKQLLTKLIGNPHSTVSLVLENSQGETVSIKLTREKITLEEDRLKIDYEAFGEGIIGFITISSFYDNADGLNIETDMRNALSELKAIAPLKGLVIDMRQNSGGFLHQAVRTAGLFLHKETVVIAKYANDEIKFTRDRGLRLFYQGPLVVLASKASASAAEILSQTLQDEGVAIIVGDEHSYGKGSMQYQTITDPDAKHFYKVTVGRYFTASGKSPQMEGVKADIVVPTIYSALNIGEKYLHYPLNQEGNLSKYTIGKNLKKVFAKYQAQPPSNWQKMIPLLKMNTALRKENDPNLHLFYKQLEDVNIPVKAKLAGCGQDDLQKKEAINILKDMILLHTQQ